MFAAAGLPYPDLLDFLVATRPGRRSTRRGLDCARGRDGMHRPVGAGERPRRRLALLSACWWWRSDSGSRTCRPGRRRPDRPAIIARDGPGRSLFRHAPRSALALGLGGSGSPGRSPASTSPRSSSPSSSSRTAPPATAGRSRSGSAGCRSPLGQRSRWCYARPTDAARPSTPGRPRRLRQAARSATARMSACSLLVLLCSGCRVAGLVLRLTRSSRAASGPRTRASAIERQAGAGDRAAAGGAGAAGPRRARRGRPLADGHLGAGRLGGVHAGRRHRADRAAMANISTSARQSLGDVRQVLSPTTERRDGGPTGGLDSLIEGVRSAGTRSSRARSAPPPAAARARRGGVPGAAGDADQRAQARPARRAGGRRAHWEAELKIEVRNVSWRSRSPRRCRRGASGLAGMRRRLEAVGGRLDVRRRDGGRRGDVHGDGVGAR